MILCSRGVVVALCLAGVGAGVVYAQLVSAACTTCSVYEALPSFLLRVHGAQPLFGPTHSTRITGRIGTYQPSYSDVGATYRAYNGYADAGLRVSFWEYLFAELSTTGAGSVAHVSSPLGGGWIEGLGAGIALGGGVGDTVTYLRAYASFTSVIVNLASDSRRLKDHLETYGAAWGLEGGTRLPLWWITLSPRVGVYGANVDFESFTDAVGARVSHRSVPRNSWSVGVVAESPMWVGSRTGAPTVGSGGNSNRFRVGPQSGSPGHVSSPRLVKRSMRISRTTLSCLLRVKGYVAVRVGSAFRAAHSSRFLLHLFHPCPPVFPPGSAFAFTYILCLRSRSSIGAFIISPLPPCFQSRYRQQGRFPPPALPGFTGTTNPSATLSPVSRLPGAPGYTAYLAPPISRRGEEGFSSCLARPRYRAVATTPPECRSALASLRYAMLLSSRTWGLSLRVFCFSRPPVRSLSLRPGNSPATPYGGRVNGLQVIVFSPPCHPCYGALALTPAGLSPAERASLCWTHKPYTMYTSVDVRQIFEGTATAVDVSGEILESAVVPTPAVDLGVGGLYHISNLSIGGSMKVDGIETGDLGFSAKMDLVVRW